MKLDSDRLRGPARWPGGWLGPTVAVLLVSFLATVGAMRRTSLTFDEVFMIPSSARGYEVGRFDMTRDHPPVTQYLYGLPVHLAGPEYPEEGEDGGNVNRFSYGQEFFFGLGNDPEKVVFRARSVAALIAVALGLSIFFFVRPRFGGPPAFLAATLTAFLPDVLAHGGVAYNDVPLALAFFLGVWALDTAAREPGMRTFAVATLACGIAMGVKLSAMALIPVAILVFLLEAVRRGNDRAWYRKVLHVFPLVPLLGYVVLVLVYKGDPLLTDFRWAFDFNRDHATDGHGYPALLLGERSLDGFWYFFPVGFFLKTPAALHVLGGLAIFGFVRTLRSAAEETDRRRFAWAGSTLRAPVVGGLGFLAFLLMANLNIGFRHGLPLLPFVTVLVAAGVWRLWIATGRPLRVVVAILVVGHVASSLSYYPWFLSYLSEYVRGRDQEYEVLVDSSLDWGQGLLALRDWMAEEDVGPVYLSYFGSALPEGYGIDYLPLESFLALSGSASSLDPDDEAAHVVVSATNLAGTYVSSARVARFRRAAPVRVLARSLYVYQVTDPVDLASGRR